MRVERRLADLGPRPEGIAGAPEQAANGPFGYPRHIGPHDIHQTGVFAEFGEMQVSRRPVFITPLGPPAMKRLEAGRVHGEDGFGRQLAGLGPHPDTFGVPARGEQGVGIDHQVVALVAVELLFDRMARRHGSLGLLGALAVHADLIAEIPDPTAGDQFAVSLQYIHIGVVVVLADAHEDAGGAGGLLEEVEHRLGALRIPVGGYRYEDSLAFRDGAALVLDLLQATPARALGPPGRYQPRRQVQQHRRIPPVGLCPAVRRRRWRVDGGWGGAGGGLGFRFQHVSMYTTIRDAWTST